MAINYLFAWQLNSNGMARGAIVFLWLSLCPSTVLAESRAFIRPAIPCIIGCLKSYGESVQEMVIEGLSGIAGIRSLFLSLRKAIVS